MGGKRQSTKLSDLNESQRVMLYECKALKDEARQKQDDWLAAEREATRLMYALRASGVPLRLIGKTVGMSGTKVHQRTQ